MPTLISFSYPYGNGYGNVALKVYSLAQIGLYYQRSDKMGKRASMALVQVSKLCHVWVTCGSIRPVCPIHSVHIFTLSFK